jgi:hypothetical protein
LAKFNGVVAEIVRRLLEKVATDYNRQAFNGVICWSFLHMLGFLSKTSMAKRNAFITRRRAA